MASPTDLRYSPTHEWFRAQDDLVTVGITQHAADELTDVTFVETKAVGVAVAAGDSVGEVESVKTTSDVFSVVSGTVAEVNPAVVADPSLVNSDPYGNGWLVRIRTTDLAPLKGLLDGATYDAQLAAH